MYHWYMYMYRVQMNEWKYIFLVDLGIIMNLHVYRISYALDIKIFKTLFFSWLVNM